MTLPASFPLSMSQIATELGLSLPLSMNHAWVLLLANKAGFPISLGDLLGKTGRFDGSGPATGNAVQLNGAPLWGGTLNYIFSQSGSGNIIFTTTPTWTGNFKLTNNTSGASAVLVWLGSGTPNQWGGSTPANLIRNGFTDNFTIVPSN